MKPKYLCSFSFLQENGIDNRHKTEKLRIESEMMNEKDNSVDSSILSFLGSPQFYVDSIL